MSYSSSLVPFVARQRNQSGRCVYSIRSGRPRLGDPVWATRSERRGVTTSIKNDRIIPNREEWGYDSYRHVG